MFRGRNIATIIWINFMILICVLVCTMGYFWIHQERKKFALESRKMESQYIETQKQILEHEVKEVIDFIQLQTIPIIRSHKEQCSITGPRSPRPVMASLQPA